jgi:hypothetical protein
MTQADRGGSARVERLSHEYEVAQDDAVVRCLPILSEGKGTLPEAPGPLCPCSSCTPTWWWWRAVSDPQIAVLLIHIPRLIAGLRIAGDAMASAKPTAAPAGGAVQANRNPFAALSVAPAVQLAKATLASLVSWGLDPTLDRLCEDSLALGRLPPNLALGHRGYATTSRWRGGPLVTEPVCYGRPRGTLTIHTPGHVPPGTELTVSATHSAQRLLALVALTNALRSLPGPKP